MDQQRINEKERIQRVENGVAPPTPNRSDQFQRLSLQIRMEDYRVPGVSLAVINNYKLEWNRGYGTLEAGKSEPVTVSTLFQVGSMGKPLTAVAALRLVDRGKLDLDEDVNKFLVSWKVPNNGSWTPRVTLRHLLSHTGGLTVETYAGYPRDHKIPNLLQVLNGTKPANSMPVRVNMIPGTQHRYSSGGYAVLQQLLIDVLEMPFPELMQELVLGPLGMNQSTFQQPLPKALEPYAASGHRNGGQPVIGKWFVYPEMAGGGLWSTPSDLARFVIELLRVGTGMEGGILSTEIMREMLSPHADSMAGPVGLGVFLEEKGVDLGFSHIGGNEGFASKMMGYFQSGMGAVVMTNWHYGLLADELVRAIGLEYQWPGFGLEETSSVEMDAEILESYIGDYELWPGRIIEITRKGDTLYFRTSGQIAMELYPDSETEFYAKVVNIEVMFFRTSQGWTSGLVFRQNGQKHLAKKVK